MLSYKELTHDHLLLLSFSLPQYINIYLIDLVYYIENYFINNRTQYAIRMDSRLLAENSNVH